LGAISFHTAMSAHSNALPMRHGVTLMQRFRNLAV
jgi:hypothetical protein